MALGQGSLPVSQVAFQAMAGICLPRKAVPSSQGGRCVTEVNTGQSPEHSHKDHLCCAALADYEQS